MTIYETMFCRRSVRRYTAPLDQETLLSILDYARRIPQMDGQHADFRVITKDEMGGNAPAPHYLVASCEATNEAYANVGYVMEKVDLYLQSLGYGSLWWGMSLPENGQDNDCIVMGMGQTEVPLRPSEEAKRLNLSAIAEEDNAITQTARLAPSAVNSQPWMLSCGEGEVVIRYHGRGLLKSRLEKKMNKVDLGIVTRFVVTELENQGKCIKAITEETVGKDFTITVRY